VPRGACSTATAP